MVAVIGCGHVWPPSGVNGPSGAIPDRPVETRDRLGRHPGRSHRVTPPPLGHEGSASSRRRKTGWSWSWGRASTRLRAGCSADAGVTGDVDLGVGPVGHPCVHQFARHARVGGDHVVAGRDHDVVGTIGVRRRAHDHLSGHIGLARDLLGNGDVDVRCRRFSHGRLRSRRGTAGPHEPCP